MVNTCLLGKVQAEHGIERQQNGVAERTNGLMDEGIATLLADAHLPALFWVLAAISMSLISRLPLL